MPPRAKRRRSQSAHHVCIVCSRLERSPGRTHTLTPRAFHCRCFKPSITQPQAGQHQIFYRLAFISAHTTDRDSRDCLYATRRQTPTGCSQHGRDRMRQRNQHSDELRDGSPPPKQDSVQTPNANFTRSQPKGSRSYQRSMREKSVSAFAAIGSSRLCEVVVGPMRLFGLGTHLCIARLQRQHGCRRSTRMRQADIVLVRY